MTLLGYRAFHPIHHVEADFYEVAREKGSLLEEVHPLLRAMNELVVAIDVRSSFPSRGEPNCWDEADGTFPVCVA
jgi:hypothetical protein